MTATDNDTTTTAHAADVSRLADRIERGWGRWSELLIEERGLIVAALRAYSPVHAGGAEVSESERLHAVIENEAIVSRDALAEVERLRERCEGYKGQIEAGSIAIQHLQGEIERLRKSPDSDRMRAALLEVEDYCTKGGDLEAMLEVVRGALSSG